MRQFELVLLRPQGFDGFNFCCASRRHIAGDQSHGEQENRYGNDGQQIVLGDSIQKTSNQPGCEECSEDSDRQAGNQKPTGLAQDHAKNILALRTEGEAHSYLSRALAHAVAQQSVESGGGDQNGSDGEDPQQSRGQCLAAELVVNMLWHGLDTVHDERRVPFGENPADGGDDHFRRLACSYDQFHCYGGDEVEIIGYRNLVQVDVDLGDRGLSEHFGCVFNDANHVDVFKNAFSRGVGIQVESLSPVVGFQDI